MARPLEGKVALITGAASGIGEATARRFAQEGARIVPADVCLFLASDLSRHVSGVEIYVDGGASLLI